MIENIKVEEVQSDGSKKEVKIDPATGYHNFLISFNSVIDLDFSILRMIQAEYNNPKYIDQKIIKRKPYTRIFELNHTQLDQLIKQNGDYGEIVCNCEKITKGEILEVLKNSPIKPLNLG